jgi:nitrogen fixation/metabolism regulation signal transduction histidine kinase
MYKTGHAFLIDNTGNTIAHKDLETTRQGQMNVNPDNTDVAIQTLESGSQEFSDVLNKMYNSVQGLETAKYEDGSINYIGYAKVAGTNFYLGIVVPELEVIESVKTTEKSIEDTTNETLMLILLIDGVALIVILVVGLALANRIVSPINQMIEVSKKLGVGEIDEALLDSRHVLLDTRKAKKDEIGTLMKSFSNMISSIDKSKEKEKELKAKEQAPIPKQLVQDIKIEIKDSVIHRSSIGTMGKGAPGTGEARYCLNCGKDLPPDFSGKFCPHCGEEP